MKLDCDLQSGDVNGVLGDQLTTATFFTTQNVYHFKQHSGIHQL
jgi:hypothetical protein